MSVNRPEDLQEPDALDELDENEQPDLWSEEMAAFRQRMSDPTPFMVEQYDANGSLLVGEGTVVFTLQRRRVLQARGIAWNYSLYRGDDRLAIALGLFPEPEDESDEERATRLLETQMQALELAGQGEFSVAIELGYLPKPKVEPEPRMVDRAGNLVQEAIAIKFAAEKRATPKKAAPIDDSNYDTWPLPEAELKARRDKESEEFEAARHVFWELVSGARPKAEVKATGRDVYAARTKEELEAARNLYWELEDAEDDAPVWERTGWERTGLKMIAAWVEAYPDPRPKEMIEAARQGRTNAEMECARWRLSTPLPFIATETYDADGNLVVGEGYVVETPEQRRIGQARKVATDYQLYRDDDRLAIAIGFSPDREDETDEEHAKRILETPMLAYALAGQGDFSVAIEAGYLPKPKVEPQPRMVDKDGNLVQEEIAIEFEF